MDPFDPKVIAELSARAKVQLRRRARAVRSAYSPATLAQRSERVVERVSAHVAFQRARSVALFWPLLERGEVDLRALDSAARATGKAVFYPFLERRGERMITGFRLTQAASDLEERGARFAEPHVDAPVAARGDLDLVIVPALAVAGDGQRLGYGMGYYDATLPDVCPPALSFVVAYDFELMAELPHSPSDFACQVVVTDQRTLEAAPAA